VDDAMTDADQPVADEPLAQEHREVFDRALVAELRSLAPQALSQGVARGVPGHEVRRRVKTLDLTAHLDGEGASAHGEEGELEA
jgi:hypothetical protein